MKNLLSLYNPYYNENVIEQHLKLLKENGVVAFGKVRSKLRDYEHPNQDTLSEIYDETAKNNPTQLFLTDYNSIYVANVISVNKTINLIKVPKYYEDLEVEYWFVFDDLRLIVHKDFETIRDKIFSVNVVLSFYLDENDPCYEEDEDNTLIEMNQRFFDIESIYGIADGVNHNDFAHWDEKVLRNGKKHVMYGDFHCWSFHGLYDHTQLQWEEILRIGSVEMNITMEMFNEARKIPKV